MLSVNSTDVRKEFGGYIDIIIRKKPIFIKRSRDYIMGISIEMAKELIKDIIFQYERFVENDNSITLSLLDFDIVVNAENDDKAIDLLLKDLSEYAEDYYHEIEYWSSDKNRKSQFPHILKVLMSNDKDELKGSLSCLTGKN